MSFEERLRAWLKRNAPHEHDMKVVEQTGTFIVNGEDPALEIVIEECSVCERQRHMMKPVGEDDPRVLAHASDSLEANT